MTPNLSPHNKDQMNPQDMRNMLIFFVLAALVYFAFDSFVLKPQRDAIKENAIKQQQIAAKSPQKTIAEQLADSLKTRDDIISSGGRITFSNAEINGTINLNGGRIDDAALKKYFVTLDKKENVTVLNPRDTLSARGIEYGWLSADQNIKTPNKNTQWSVTGNAALSPDTPVTMIWDNGQGIRFERTLTLDNEYMFGITQRVVNNSGRAVTLYPYGLIAQKGIPPTFAGTWISHEGPIGFHDDELFNESYKSIRKDKKFVQNSDTGWIGFTDKYWLTALIPPQTHGVKYTYKYAGPEKDKDNIGLYQTDFLGTPTNLQPGQSTEVQSRLFVGAKKVLTLKDYEKKYEIPQFDLAVDFGLFWFMTKPFFYALHYLGLWIGNLGIAIILITIALRGAVFPLTNKSYTSFAKMKKVAPQVTELREKYGDDKQKMQQELIAMYQREGVNPMSGCLPILVQIPIFFALYKTFFVTIELRHAPFFGWIKDLSAPDPTSIFNLFGLIPWDPPSILMIGVWPCLMLLAMIIQKKLNPPPQDPLQRDIANYMPFLFAFIMSKFAAGLVVYWTFSAFIGVLQQMIIMKRLNVPIHLFGETEEEEEAKKAVDKGPALHPLTEMAEDEVEEAMGLKEKDEPTKPIKPPKPKKSKKKKK